MAAKAEAKPQASVVMVPPKVTVINRSTPVPISATPDVEIKHKTKIYTEPVVPPVQPGEIKVVVDDISEDPKDRNREKKEINDLNDRLEKLLQRTRDAETVNKDAASKLKTLRDNLGKDTRAIKDKYDHKLHDLRAQLQEAENKRGELEVRLVSLQAEMDDLRGKIDEETKRIQNDKDQLEKNSQRLNELKSECALLERKLAQLDAERQNLREQNAKLLDELNKHRVDLDQESIARIRAENHAYCLQEELEFLRRVWEQEQKELEKLAQRDGGSQGREFWRAEITTLQNDIQSEFDDQLNKLRQQLADTYELKLQELGVVPKTDDLPALREEVKRNRASHQQLQSKRDQIEPKVTDYEKQYQDARDAYEDKVNQLEQALLDARRQRDASQAYIQNLIDELRHLLELKVSLENEIMLYRKLLEDEEKKQAAGPGGPGDVNEDVKSKKAAPVQAAHPAGPAAAAAPPAAAAAPAPPKQPAVSEMRAKTTSSKTAKGTVEIGECAMDGKFVSVSNTGKKEEEITGWKILRNVENGKTMIEFVFPKCFLGTEGKAKTVTVWGKGMMPKDAQNDFEMKDKSWGLGSAITTTLSNPDGEERAQHSQKTVFTS